MSNGGGASISGHILDEARELRRKQDERLRGLQALSRSMLAGFLSAGLIAFAVQPVADTGPEQPEAPKHTPPEVLPSVTVSRGLIGIPEILRFWRWNKANAA